jgi:hypothetical protein
LKTGTSPPLSSAAFALVGSEPVPFFDRLLARPESRSSGAGAVVHQVLVFPAVTPATPFVVANQTKRVMPIAPIPRTPWLFTLPGDRVVRNMFVFEIIDALSSITIGV